MTGVQTCALPISLFQLEREGFIRTERAVGKYVSDNEELIEVYKKEYIHTIVLQFVQQMESMGIDRKDIIKYLEEENHG